MPANVRAGQIVSLVEVVGGLRSKIDIPRLADELGADIAVLLPIIDAGEMLGLVRSEKGDVFLTDFGLKFQKTVKYKVRLLHDDLAKIEPFRSAIELVSRKGEASAGEITDQLARYGLTWHHDREVNEALVRTMLIHWAIYAGLLNYDGRKDKFRKV
jgi:hypothetical protein